jgi:TPR repeat protein
MGFVDRERWAEELTDEVKGLLEDGVALMGGNYERQLKHSNRSEPWPGAVLQAVPLAEAQQPREPAKVMPIADATEIALAHVLIDKGDTTRAEERLRPLAERGNPHAALLLGMLLRDGNRLADAADWLGRAAEAGSAEALTPLGLLLHELGRLDEAEAVLRRAAGAEGPDN